MKTSDQIVISNKYGILLHLIAEHTKYKYSLSYFIGKSYLRTPPIQRPLTAPKNQASSTSFPLGTDQSPLPTTILFCFSALVPINVRSASNSPSVFSIILTKLLTCLGFTPKKTPESHRPKALSRTLQNHRIGDNLRRAKPNWNWHSLRNRVRKG